MADNATGLNQQYDSPPFGMSAAVGNTGAPGSEGDLASQSEGPVIGSPVVSAPYGSSQLAVNMPRQAVQAGDTSGMSSDQAVGDNFSVISGDSPAALTSTGAGDGSNVMQGHHPNSGSRP